MTESLEDLVKLLGGRRSFDPVRVHDNESLARAIQNGLASEALRAFLERTPSTSVAGDAVLRLVGMSRRTYERRLASGYPLSTSESDRLVRVARVYLLASKWGFDGDEAMTRAWLFESPHRSKGELNGQDRIALLETEIGMAIVLEAIERLHERRAAKVSEVTA